jgi:GMP synthase (glutamine-hydrolysing)
LERILVLDFGAQYAHLICRRIRELGVYCELVPFNIKPEEIKRKNAKGLIFSGGPRSVYDALSPLPDKEVYGLGLPILGICYGLQAIVHQQGGKVIRSKRKEFGKTRIRLNLDSPLFRGMDAYVTCWMSHGDAAEKLPKNFETIAWSDNSPYAAISSGKIFAVQFHPEVTHTPVGMKLLSNFVFDVCHLTKNWSPDSLVERTVEEIRSIVGPSGMVICALSGGVDSSTTATLVEKAIGKRLVCVFVDNGLLREGERKKIEAVFKPRLGKNLIVIDAKERFLSKLNRVVDPEKKRMIVGREFIKIFLEYSRRVKSKSEIFLSQGTLYTDVVESAAAQSKKQSVIKSHHNVGGLPKRLGFKLIEPLRDLYKDEVRRVASAVGLPDEIINAHPFPGPGLAVRIIGDVSQKKLRICRHASAIVENELRERGLYNKVWQAFAVVGDDLATGVRGDERAIGHVVIVRVVESTDAMTADWYRIPHEVIEKISNRITNEIPEVTWVAYAVSSKPPSTIEPQ